MPSFGNYEAVSELYRGGLGRVWTARGVAGGGEGEAGGEGGGEPTFAVKTCEPNVAVVGERAAAEAVRRFVEQARVQLEVSRGGASCWAPVHAIIEEDSSAAYVTDLFSRSAERLVTGRLRVDGRGLQRITGSVVEGLLQMEERAGRGHGNLKPTNVLIDAATDLGLARVALTDPAASADAKTAARDLRAVGDLIHRLVLHQPFTERSAWPIATSPEWSRLGRTGQAWLELANRLLSPKPDEARPSLEELKAQIEALTAKGGNKGLLIAGAAAAVLILGGGVTLAVLATGGGDGTGKGGIVDGDQLAVEQAWRELNREYVDWYAELERQVRGMDAQRAERWRKDETLRKVLDQVAGAEVDPREIVGTGGRYDLWAEPDSVVPQEVLRGDASKRVRAARETVRGVKVLLTEQWPAPTVLEEAAVAWEGEGYGWSAASAPVREVVEALRAPDNHVAGAIDAVLATAARVREVQARWAAVEESMDVIEGRQDPVLARFRSAAAAWVGGGEPAAGALVDESRLGEVERLAGDLRNFVETGWAEFDHDTFAQTNELYQRLASGEPIEKEQFHQWLHAATSENAKLPQGADPRPGWEITGRAADLHDLLHTIAGEVGVALEAAEGEWAVIEAAMALAAQADEHGTQVQEAGALLEAARGHATAIHHDQVRWTRGTAETIKARMAEADQSMERARLALSDVLQRIRLDKETTLAQVRTAVEERREISSSGAVNAAWEEGKAALLARYGPDSGLRGSDLSREAQGLADSLKQVADAGGALSEDLGRVGLVQQVEQALRGKRERAIEAALAKLGGSGGSLPPGGDPAYAAAAEQVRREVAAWVEDADQMARALMAVSDRLNLGYGLDEGGDESPAAVYRRWSGEEVFSDSFGVNGPSPLSERLAGLEQVQALSGRAALSAEIHRAQQGRQERAIAAYRRLDEFPASTVEELAGELVLADRMKLALDDVASISRARREALEAEFAEARRVRWRAFAEAAEDAATLASALELRERFGVELTRQAMGEPLYADAQVNALVQALHAAGEDDDKARAAAEAFVASIESASLSRGVLDQEPLAGVLAGVKGVLGGEEVAPPRVPPTTIGPGALEGWAGVEEADGRVVFTHAAAGLELEFVRVEGAGGGAVEPFYIMTTELSLQQFAGIDALSNGAVTSLLGVTEDVQEYWNGPRVWRLAGGRIGRNAYWLQDSPIYRSHPAYPSGLGDPENRRRLAESQGRPDESMPMQYLPAATAVYAAKLVGCRLPTSAEWKAALREVGGGEGAGATLGANLRDATWTRQQQHFPTFPGNPTGVTWPDAGAFQAAGVQVGSDARATAWPGLDDGTLWFRPVKDATRGNASARVQGMVGNVAEWVFEDAAAVEALPDATSVLSFLANPAEGTFDPQQAGQVGVIGGSALSAPELEVDVKLSPVDPYTAVTGAFADVGMRLVFPARGTGRETFAQKLAGVLGEEPFLTVGR